MSNADRIEELRTKYEENPRRYFAPLANEFRKAGDLAQAIAICREHLPKQPGHMSGYIVFGQTLFEANNLEEARTVFEQALTLDPENLIALKHLGDIARMNGENSTARRWYARVLDADPRNDDIASQLASLGAPTPAIPVVAVVEEQAPAPLPALDEHPGVFATFDPASLLDLPEDVLGISGTSSPDKAHTEEPELAQTFSAELDEAAPAPLERAETETPALRAAQEARFDARHEPLDLDFPDDPEPPAGEEFEEGILAPEWPDTSSLVARIVTPVRSATPLSVPATVEAVSAFGREHTDPVEDVTVDVPVSDELVDAFLPADVAAPSSAPAGQSFLAELESAELEAAEFDATPFEMQDLEAPLAEVQQEIPVTAQVENDDDATVDLEVTAEYAIPVLWTPEEVEPESVETFASVPEETPLESEGEPWQVPELIDEAVPTDVHVHTFDAEAESGFEMIGEFVADVDVTSDVDSGTDAEVVASDEPVEVLEESFAAMSSELESERVQEEPEEKAPTFVTETMAELLVSQGFVSRAVEVYDELVRRRPHDPVLVARLNELRTSEQDAVQHANELLAQHQSFETPALGSPAFGSPSVTPLYSTPLSNTPLHNTPLRATPVFTPHASTSGQQHALHSAQLNAQQAFRSARERFAELASRRVARRTPTHATAIADDQADGLSTLFGTSQPTTTDELAARALADAFGPVQDSGESLFDPAPMPTPAAPLRALTPRHTTPVPGQAQVNSEPRSDRQPASDYSFDKFFPDPAMTHRDAHAVHSSSAAAQDTSQPVNEDLAQFSAWLKGLNNA